MVGTRVDTSKVSDRRELHFSSLDELAADVERIAAAERAGSLRRTGNWTPGQTFGHLATWMNFAYDGYPADMKPPWIIKMLLKLQKSKFFKGPMPRGVKIPGVEGGTKGTDRISLDEGLTKLRSAIAKLKSTAPTLPNPVFGPLSHEEWKAMHLRHAELHLGYLHPK